MAQAQLALHAAGGYQGGMLSLLCTLALLQTPQWQTWAQPITTASAAMRAKIPVVDQVVVVPDMPTMLDELGKWSPAGHWPILIEGDPRNVQFIRRFAPGRVLRRDRHVAAADAAAVESAVAAAWDVPVGHVPETAAEVLGVPVPGIVLADPGNSARGGAAMLAAGRGQHLGWVAGDFGRSGGRLTPAQGRALCDAVEAACEATGASWNALGDAIDTVTLCRDLAARVEGGERSNSDNPSNPPALAVTDVVGRHADGRRWAWTGWIFGDAKSSVWQANCSLFLPRTRVWLGDSYPAQPPWTTWKLAAAADVFTAEGYTVQITDPLTPDTLTRAAADGLEADLMMLVSKGNADFFRLAGDVDVDASQVPVCRTPAAVYMLHSWSLRAPYDARTVGGRWLSNGAYADVGSSQEPMLQAFVPPELIAKRVSKGIPWLIASRYWPGTSGAASNPWRINTIGDPLMLAPAPGSSNRHKIQPEGESGARYTSMLQIAQDALKQAAVAASDDVFAEGIHAAVMANRQTLALQIYSVAQGHAAAGPKSAAAVLATAAFNGKINMVLHAATTIGTLSRGQADLVWAAGAPKLVDGTADATLIHVLRSCIDATQSAGRVRLLAQAMRSTQGALATSTMIEHFLAQAKSARQKKELQKILSGV